MWLEDAVILSFRKTDELLDCTALWIIKGILGKSLQYYGSNPHMYNSLAE